MPAIFGSNSRLKNDRVPKRSVCDVGVTSTISGMGRIGQITMAGNPTTGSSLKCGSCSSVMYERAGPRLSFCSSSMAPTSTEDRFVVGEDADDVGSAFDLAVEPFGVFWLR